MNDIPDMIVLMIEIVIEKRPDRYRRYTTFICSFLFHSTGKDALFVLKDRAIIKKILQIFLFFIKQRFFLVCEK